MPDLAPHAPDLALLALVLLPLLWIRALRGRVARLRGELRALRPGAEAAEARLADRDRALEAAHAALQAERARTAELTEEAATLRARLEAERTSAQAQIESLTRLREEIERRFGELANRTMRAHREEFQNTSAERLGQLLSPLKDDVDRFQREIRQLHTSAAQERSALKAEIAMLTRRSEEVGREATALTRALKGEKARQGAWGEMILERLLEGSGLVRDTHYTVQESTTDPETGRRARPDVVVRMPRGRAVVIDSKVSLTDYEAATNTDDPDTRARHLKAHARAVRAHVDGLAARGYAQAVDGSIDYVLMFLPVEGALAEAMRTDPALAEEALARGIGLMSPLTLMMMLRTVEHIWTVERRQENAEEIAARAGRLYDKVAGFVEEFDAVGTHLDRAARAHETAMTRLSRGKGNVLSQIERLKAMGARTDRTLPVTFDAEEEEAAADDAPRLARGG